MAQLHHQNLQSQHLNHSNSLPSAEPLASPNGLYDRCDRPSSVSDDCRASSPRCYLDPVQVQKLSEKAEEMIKLKLLADKKFATQIPANVNKGKQKYIKELNVRACSGIILIWNISNRLIQWKIQQELVKMPTNNPDRMDRMRKYAAIFGRFDCKRKADRPLSLHEVCMERNSILN